jgi:hypothetical protein
MKQTVFWALVALNALLLATLIAPYFRSNTAMAQRGGGRRPDILMIPGEVQGGNSAVVYLIDTANRRLGAIMLNNKGNGLDAMAPQPLDRVFEDRNADAGKPKDKGARKP